MHGNLVAGGGKEAWAVQLGPVEGATELVRLESTAAMALGRGGGAFHHSGTGLMTLDSVTSRAQRASSDTNGSSLGGAGGILQCAQELLQVHNTLDRISIH